MKTRRFFIDLAVEQNSPEWRTCDLKHRIIRGAPAKSRKPCGKHRNCYSQRSPFCVETSETKERHHSYSICDLLTGLQVPAWEHALLPMSFAEQTVTRRSSTGRPTHLMHSARIQNRRIMNLYAPFADTPIIGFAGSCPNSPPSRSIRDTEPRRV